DLLAAEGVGRLGVDREDATLALREPQRKGGARMVVDVGRRRSLFARIVAEHGRASLQRAQRHSVVASASVRCADGAAELATRARDRLEVPGIFEVDAHPG